VTTITLHPDCEPAASASPLRDLAASVILQALADLRCNDLAARTSALRFIRDMGGGVWADLLGIEREAIRRAAPIVHSGGKPAHKARRLAAMLDGAA
jgi:hypothetical protein